MTTTEHYHTARREAPQVALRSLTILIVELYNTLDLSFIPRENRMQRAWRSLLLLSACLVAALWLPATAHAQGVPEGKAGNPDSSQTQRERTPIDLSTIDKPKPEVEIFMGPDLGGAPPTGIVIVPDEAAKTPSPPVPSAQEGDSSPKKKDR